jgi:hypothetical protein
MTFVCKQLIKDEVLLTVGCPIFPPFYIDSQISVHRKEQVRLFIIMAASFTYNLIKLVLGPMEIFLII